MAKLDGQTSLLRLGVVGVVLCALCLLFSAGVEGSPHPSQRPPLPDGLFPTHLRKNINNNHNNRNPRKGPNTPRADAPTCTDACTSFSTAKPVNMTVGVYIIEISQVDPVGQNYYMAGYYWLYWPTCTKLAGGEDVSSDTVKIENQSAQWGLVSNLDPSNDCTDSAGQQYTCPTCDTPWPGYSYVTYRFSANLKLTFTYKRYPLDEQELYIAFEDLESQDTLLHLQPDKASNYHETVNVISFDIVDVIRRTIKNKQRTNYGIANQSEAVYSRVELGIVITRNPVFFTLRVLPPALVTLSVAALVLFIDPMAVETRLGVAITGLLTLVLMGLGFSEKIPDVADLTVNDWFFDWCYFLLLLVVIECVFISSYISKVSKILLHADLGSADLLDGLFNPKWEARKQSVLNLWRRVRGKPEKEGVNFAGSEMEYSSTTPFKKFGDEDMDVELMVQDNKEKAKRFIHQKLTAAKKLDYILASIILLLATVGSVIVIILAKYA